MVKCFDKMLNPVSFHDWFHFWLKNHGKDVKFLSVINNDAGVT